MNEEPEGLTVEKILRAKRLLSNPEPIDIFFICPSCKCSITMLHVSCPNCGVQLK